MLTMISDTASVVITQATPSLARLRIGATATTSSASAIAPTIAITAIMARGHA